VTTSVYLLAYSGIIAGKKTQATTCNFTKKRPYSGARAPSTSSNDFVLLTSDSHKVYNDQLCIWFFISYSFENKWNWQRDTIESTEIVFILAEAPPQTPLGGAYNATFNPLSGWGGGMPLPFFT